MLKMLRHLGFLHKLTSATDKNSIYGVILLIYAL